MLFRILVFSILFMSFSRLAAAQATQGEDSCYRQLRQAGIQFMNEGNFANAINQFWAALECPDLEAGHDLNQKIKEVQTKWVNTLKSEVNRAQAAEKEADQARATAIQAEAAEKEARKAAEANAVKARNSGLLAESLRLSLLSENTRLQDQKSDALALAFLSLQLSKLSGRDTFSSGMRAFAQAVRDSMEEKLFQADLPIGAYELLPGGKGMVVQSGNSIYIVNNQSRISTQLEVDAMLPHASATSDDGDLVLTFTDDGKAQLWNQATHQAAPISGHGESILAGDFAPGNQMAITGSRDNTAKVWSAQGRATATFSGHEANVYGVQCSPDGRHFLTRSADGTARIWSQQGQCLGILSDEAGYIYDARFTPTGSQVYTAGASGQVKVWNLQGQLQHVCRGHQQPAREIVFLNKGQLVMTRSQDAVMLWNTEGQLLATMAHPGGHIAGLRFNQDSTLAVTWEDDGPLAILWDEQGHRLQAFSGHQGVILSAELSPRGDMLLTTATDGTAKLWDRNGHILIDWNLRTQHPTAALFSADGQYVFTAQNDNQALMSCPTPYQAYDQLAAHTGALAQKVEELRQRYQIQFLEGAVE
ncbi:MAG: WD40 repeat domain-containing protein [Lewinellaceae bacterium]|nr:WD40 repeat domain-containing protein [Lewinellaceae bacterium]